MPAIDISGCCIPAECDNIKLPYNGEIASRWDAYLLCDICRHFASAMLHFASLISHNLRCIPAYAHQIPTGFFQSLLNYHRDNLYIISLFYIQSHLTHSCLRQIPSKGRFWWCFLGIGFGKEFVGWIWGDVVGEKFVDFRALNLVIEGFFRKFVCFMTQASKRALRTL